jgi:hypothetical protein
MVANRKRLVKVIDCIITYSWEPAGERNEYTRVLFWSKKAALTWAYKQLKRWDVKLHPEFEKLSDSKKCHELTKGNELRYGTYYYVNFVHRTIARVKL